MATRSFIAKKNPTTGRYTSIYVHWDGYPTGVGLTLRDHYKTDEKVNFLLEQGDISSLHETVVETVKESYRTRGDKNVDAMVFHTLDEMCEHYRSCWCEYGYIWMDGKWSCLVLATQTVNLYTLNKETANV